jgi:hypothetical protein
VFSAVVRANFEGWDANGDGQLTLDEIETAMITPRYKGDVGVAVATFRFVDRYHYAREDKKIPPFTLRKLQVYEAAAARKRELEHDYDKIFQEMKEKLARTPRELFPDKVPLLTAVKQGNVGDCWLMSMLGALVHMHPDKVCQMVKPGKGKHYLVQFDGVNRPVQILEPTDAEIALNTSAEKNGLWLTVIEKAFAVYTNRQQPTGARQLSPVDILSGGAAADAIAVLTGHGYRPVGPNHPKFEELLMAAVADRCLICTSLRPKVETEGLYHGHVYAVIGYDDKARGKPVTVFDPLGEDFTPEEGKKPGPVAGYKRKDGVMQVPLKEFKQVFSGLGCEDPKKTPDSKKKG